MVTSTWQRSETLTPSECMTLLASVRLGRLAWVGPQGPLVLPVNHTVVDGNVCLRTDLYTDLAEGTSSGSVAFEADELDDRLRSGWSVVLLGQVEHIESTREMADLFARMEQPWAPGSRPLIVRVIPSQVTGRRFQRL